MRVVLDTNVLISGIFFGGYPHRILKAWRDDEIELLASPDILREYQRVLNALAKQHKAIEVEPWLDFLTIHLRIELCPKISVQVCEDLDDDMFVECALFSGSKVIVSGDKHLLDVTGFNDLDILKPRAFVDKYLKG